MQPEPVEENTLKKQANDQTTTPLTKQQAQSTTHR